MHAASDVRITDEAPWDELEMPIEEWTLDEFDDSAELESLRSSRGFDAYAD